MSSSGVAGPDLPRGRDTILLEREADLAVIARALAGAGSGQGSLVVVEGQAGIGKTTLLRTASTQARTQDVEILTARGLALEQDFAFGVVRQLFEPVRAAAPRDWADLLDGAAALAERAFNPAEVEPVEADVPYATIHGLFWLAANLSLRRPLVMVVDDAHWADPPSLRWLAHLGGRLDGLRILVLLAVRSGPEARAAPIEELSGLTASTRLRPASLGPESVADVVHRRLGDDVNPELCRTCHAVTGGNPFLLESLLSALGEDPAFHTDGARTAIERLGPEPVARMVTRRLARLPAGGDALAQAVAVLGGPTWLRHAAGLAGLELDVAARLADGLRAAAVFASGTMLEFEHPIVRAAIYEAIPLGERAIAHARAARLLEAEGAAAERVALHLLQTEPAGRPETVGLLRAAARDASGRGAPDAAAAFLRRALDEPPPPGSRPALLLELGLALAASRTAGAPPALREAVSTASDPHERAEAALRSARVLGIWAYHDAAIDVCREALVAGDVLDPETASQLEAELVANARVVLSASDEALTRTAAHRADPERSNAWRINLAFAATYAGRPAHETLEWLAPALAEGFRGVAPDSLAVAEALFVLVWNDQFAVADEICEAALDSARSRGSMSMVAHVSCVRAMIGLRRGDLESAASDARLALDFKLSTSPPMAVAWAAAFCIEALAGLGRFEEADEIAAVAVGRKPPIGSVHTLTLLQARGALRCAQGRFEEGLGDFLEAGGGWARLGVVHPDAACWRIGAVEASVAIGDCAEAARLAEEQLTLARRLGTPRLVGAALRASAATADDDRAEGLLREAVDLLQATPARLELARALADIGALQRRTGRRRDARGPLLRSLDLADRMAATPLAARARAELLAAGARPRRTALTGPAALTSAERRVSDLAAQGLTNRQIAQRLFVTLPTVETHLRHAFQKLDVASRHQLVSILHPGTAGSGSNSATGA